MLFSSASAAFAATNPSKSATSTSNSGSTTSSAPADNSARRDSDAKSDKPNGRSARITSMFRQKTTTEPKTPRVSSDPNHESTSSAPYSKPKSTDGEEQQFEYGPKWTPFPSSTPTALADKLNEMYWSATHSEVKRVILTLRDWDRSGVVLEEETALEEFDLDNYDDGLYGPAKGINGFETFLEQVYGESRDFANRYRTMYKRGSNTDLKTILAERIQTEIYYANLVRLKHDVKASLKLIEQKKENRDERRARLLLQSLGLLDIDKLVEYQERELQPPQRPSKVSGSRPEACIRGPSPQIRFLGVDEKTGDLKLGVETCAEPGCGSVLRGVMFSQTEELDKATEFICEGCFWLAKANGNADRYVMFYKHSVLDERIITKDVSQQLCKCTSVYRTDEFENEVAFFPVNSGVLHNKGASNSSCALLRLNHMVADAKFSDLLGEVERRKTLAKIEKEARKKQVEAFRKIQRRKASVSLDRRPGISSVGLFGSGTPNLYHTANADKQGMKNTWKKVWKTEDEEANVDSENMHISVMIGPLIIENSTRNANGGAAISVRHPGQLGMQYDSRSILRNSIIEDCVNISEQRQCFVSKRGSSQRRLKACMKQIVGGTFVKGGYIHPVLEEEIVKQLVIESKNSQTLSGSKLEESTYKIVGMLRNLLENHVKAHLNLISQKLFNPDIKLRWSSRTNNCQQFCDNLLDWAEFGPLVYNSTRHPVYLFSFLTRPAGSCSNVDIKTKFDVPNGLTEEYLLQFRHNTSNSGADIIDTLHEYWHDWGSMGGHIYKNHSLFPWDCTEAYGKHPTKCNDCNLAKHVWSHPFDSWSIIQLHLSKERQLYPRNSNNPNNPLPLIDTEWIENRLKVLLAQDALSSGALAMTRSPMFRAGCQWLALATQGNVNLDRVKLGGIHRAQPFSHEFEKAKYHEYFVAPWAHMRRDFQIKEYEKLRDRKAQLADINLTREPEDLGDSSTDYVTYTGAIQDLLDTDGNKRESGGFDEEENWCAPFAPDYCRDGFDGAHGDAGDPGGGDGDGGGGGDWGGGGGGGGGGGDGGGGGGGDGGGGGGCG